MLMLNSSDIPLKLQSLPQPPEQLFTEGAFAELLQRPLVGIVGSRKVSPYGRQVTDRLATELSRRGVVVVSGLALGVDSIAHKAAIEAGGQTIAVLPGPLDQIYPATHSPLARRIITTGGALVTEYPAGTPTMRHHFIARNRLIAGLADVLLVTEAALKSGSLHTARFALEQGKDVLAVPGNITSATSEGTNNLIKAGAEVATRAEDILLAVGLPDETRLAPVGDTPAEQVILDLLAAGIQDGNVLHRQSNLPIQAFNQSLTMLEINGKVRALGANRWSL